MSGPKRKSEPLGLSSHPLVSPGSDQTRSDADGRGSFLISLISSTADIEGDKPPCTQNTLQQITALKLMKSKARSAAIQPVTLHISSCIPHRNHTLRLSLCFHGSLEQE